MSGDVDDIDTVVDADLHVTDNQSAILPYLDDPFGRMSPAEREDAIVAAFLPGSGVAPELGHRWYCPIYPVCSVSEPVFPAVSVTTTST